MATKYARNVDDVKLSRKIVVFTTDLAYSVRRGIVEIDNAIPNLSWLIVIHSPKKSPTILLRNQWRNLARNGWRWIPYQIFEVLHLALRSRPGRITLEMPGYEFTLPALESRANVQLLRVPNIHASDTLETIRAFEPDLGLSLAAPILRAQLFSIPKLGTLNLHKGKVPDYRGMPPAFWELWNDEQFVGCTVHWVEAKLDTGCVVTENTIKRQEYSTLRSLQLRLDEVGVELMTKAVSDVLNGIARSVSQKPGGKTYRKPTLSQVAAFERKASLLVSPRISIPLRSG